MPDLTYYMCTGMLKYEWLVSILVEHDPAVIDVFPLYQKLNNYICRKNDNKYSLFSNRTSTVILSYWILKNTEGDEDIEISDDDMFRLWRAVFYNTPTHIVQRSKVSMIASRPVSFDGHVLTEDISGSDKRKPQSILGMFDCINIEGIKEPLSRIVERMNARFFLTKSEREKYEALDKVLEYKNSLST